MKMNKNEVTGIILAGGNSSRLGFDKGMAKVAGRTLTEIAISNLRTISSEIIISTNNPDYQIFGYPLIPDLIPGIGPMGGIYSALKQCNSRFSFILSVDLPFVNRGLLEYIIGQSAHCDVAVPWSGGDHYEPLCACYNLSVLSEMELSIEAGNYKLPDLFGKVSVKKIEISSDAPFFHHYLFQNINTKTDLDTAQKLTHLIK